MARAWGAQQWLRFTKESAWGTFDGAAAAGDIHWVPLEDGAFVLDGDPDRWKIRAASDNLFVQGGATKVGYTGSLRVPLYPTMAIDLMTWLCVPTGSGSAIALDSFTADHFDGVEVKRSLGCRFNRGRVMSSHEGDGQVCRAEFDLTAKDQDTTTLAQPADSVFPFATENPYIHDEISGAVSIGGSVVSSIRELSVEVRNILYAAFHESTTIDRLNFCGRDVTVNITLADPIVTNRTRFEGQTAIAVDLGWVRASPAHEVTFNLHGNCRVDGRTVERRFDMDQYEALTIVGMKDATAGAILTGTFS